MAPRGTAEAFDPGAYWKSLVRGELTLEKVGNVGCGIPFNRWVYRQKGEALETALLDSRVALKGARIFEAAFGVGHYLRRWRAEAPAQVAGLDISDAATRAARAAFPDFDLRCGDLADPPVDGADFDAVFALDVLYHIVEDRRWDAALRGLARRVASGGVLIFSDQFWPERASRTAHVRRRRLNDYVNLLASEGIEVERRHVFTRYLGHDWVSGLGPRIPSLAWLTGYRATRLATRIGLQDPVGEVMGAMLYALEQRFRAPPGSSPCLELVQARRN